MHTRRTIPFRLAVAVVLVVVLGAAVFAGRALLAKNDAREDRISDLACDMGSYEDC